MWVLKLILISLPVWIFNVLILKQWRSKVFKYIISVLLYFKKKVSAPHPFPQSVLWNLATNFVRKNAWFLASFCHIFRDSYGRVNVKKSSRAGGETPTRYITLNTEKQPTQKPLVLKNTKIGDCDLLRFAKKPKYRAQSKLGIQSNSAYSHRGSTCRYRSS